MQKVAATGRTTIVTLTAAELAIWRTTMRPVWEMFVDDIGAERIEVAGAPD